MCLRLQSPRRQGTAREKQVTGTKREDSHGPIIRRLAQTPTINVVSIVVKPRARGGGHGREMLRSPLIAMLGAAVMASTLAANSLAAGSFARAPTRSERAAIMKSFMANDGNSSGVGGVYVSRSNSALAVICQRTPEAGVQAYVFGRSHGSWRYLTSGSPGRAGSAADRNLERACP